MKNILLVDDDLSDFNSVVNLLKAHYKVSLANTGIQALEVCRRHIPDLILLDIDMSKENGFVLIEHLKKDTKSIPVIILSDANNSEIEAKGFECGAVDVMIKPLTKSSIYRIDAHLKRHAYEQHLEGVVEELEKGMAISFGKLIAYRDYETGEHAVRTRAYVKLLVQEIQSKYPLEDAYFDMLVQSAPLHDIGKLGISDNVLLKPGELTLDESKEMRKHTILGAKMLEEIIAVTPSQGYLQIAKEIAIGHHECYDGSGYPYGLKGEEIPLGARIMAVADVYDALISHRIYRKGMSHEAACDIIIAGREKQFDPIVVDAFINIKDKFYEVAQEIGRESEN